MPVQWVKVRAEVALRALPEVWSDWVAMLDDRCLLSTVTGLISPGDRQEHQPIAQLVAAGEYDQLHQQPRK